MAEENNGVFGFEYLEDAELEQSDVVGCASMLKIASQPIVCDIPRFPDWPTGPIVNGPILGGPVLGGF